MPDRYALIVDEDETFRSRLAAILAPGGFEILEAQAESDALDLFSSHNPEAVFITVDLPEKEGFVLFSKIKKLRRVVPVFLASSTVPRSELKLHEKLKVHAHAYWDKREVTDAEIQTVLASKIGLVIDVDEGTGEHERIASGPPATEESAPGSRPVPEPWLSELLDPETASVLAEIDEDGLEALIPARPEGVEGSISPEQVAELGEEITRLREELEHARQDARSSPFSSEFSNLRDAASRKDKEIRSLEKALGKRHQQIAIVKGKLTDVAKRVLEGQRVQEAATERRVELENALDAARAKLKRLELDSEEQRERFESDRRHLKETLAAEQAATAEARRALEVELGALRASHDESLRAAEAEQKVRDSELEALRRRQRLQWAEELKAKYAEKLQELQDVQVQALSTVRDQHRKELETLHVQHREAAEKSAAEARETLIQAAEKSALLLEQANQQRLAELARAEAKRLADVEEAQRRRQGDIDELVRKHVAENERLGQEIQTTRTAAEKVHAEYTGKLQDLVLSLEEERNRHQETAERYERELAEIQTSHTKNLEQAEQDQFSALAGLSRKFREERTQLVDTERRRAEERVAKLEREHKDSLTGLAARHAEEITLLQTAHENELLRKVGDQEQQVSRRVENLRAELKEEMDKAARAHADELASLRQQQENETASLRASHMEALAARDRESQSALRDAVDAARSDHAEQLAAARREAHDAQLLLRKEYEQEIETLERAHQEAVSKRDREAREALHRVELQQDEARLATDGLQAELTELRAKQRSTLATTKEQHEAELLEERKQSRQKLSQAEEEKQFLAASIEKVKRQSQAELTRTLDALAHEKKLHQGTRDRYERRVAELKTGHSESIKNLESDWMKKLEGLEQSLIARNDNAFVKAEETWREKLDRERLQNEEAVKALTNDFTMELATLRQQVERARTLEETYRAAAQEITSLQARIESLTEEVTEVRMKLAESEAEVDVYKKKLSDTTGSIDSLKAVIDDFSRSVQGFDREQQESGDTIDSLKAVIDDFYRSIDGSEPHN